MQEQNRTDNELDTNTPTPDEQNLWKTFKNNWASSNTRQLIFTNFGIFVLIYAYLIYNAMYNFAVIEHEPECIIDKFQNWTLDINQFFGVNKWYRFACMIIASLMMDLIVFTLACRTIMQARSLRLLICIAIFYGFRAWLQNIFFMRLPEHYLWEYPGFFSIGVEYFPKNDFFYSGHIGVLMISTLEFKTDKQRLLTYFGVIGIIFNFFVLLVTRSHYSIDLIMGLIMGHYCYLASGWIVDYFRQPKPALEDEKSRESKKIN